MKRVLERVPLPGEVAWIDGGANVVYATHPIRFAVEGVEASHFDVRRGRDLGRAVWLYLTGWSLSPGGQRGRHQLIPVLRIKIKTIVDVPTTPARTCLPRYG